MALSTQAQADIKAEIKRLRVKAERLPQGWPERQDYNDQVDDLVAHLLADTEPAAQ